MQMPTTVFRFPLAKSCKTHKSLPSVGLPHNPHQITFKFAVIKWQNENKFKGYEQFYKTQRVQLNKINQQVNMPAQLTKKGFVSVIPAESRLTSSRGNAE